MGELTNKRLEQIANNERIPVTDPEIGDMARELLALRSLRDAGDEEVERISVEMEACFVAQNDDVLLTGEERSDAQSTLIDLARQIRDIAIARGQQLREAREEIERLKSRKIECCTCGHEMVEVDGQFGCEHCDHEYDGTCECWRCHHSREHESMKSQIATLAAEREEARKEVEAANLKLSGAWNLIINNDEFDRCISSLKTLYGIAAEHAASHETKNAARDVLEVCGVAEKMRDGCVSRDSQIESLQAELTALKSCPAMAEVDALVAKEDSLSAKMSAGHYLLFINACDIARRSIVAREEVVGLLKELWTFGSVRELIDSVPSSKSFQRKGIWILGRVLHLCPSRVMCEATNDELVDILSSEGDETSARFYKTVRDLMLAGF